MMGLLDRTRSERASSRQLQPSPLTPLHDQPVILFHDFDAPPQSRTTLRPQTADAENRGSKLARMSFFEAFALDAGHDTFAFPKPLSAKTAPKEIEVLANLSVSRETSPLIGVAIGSPTHPPQYWTRFPSANATPRTPRFMETFIEEAFIPGIIRSETQPARSTPWKRVGNLFRRSTKKPKVEKSKPAMNAQPVIIPEPPRPKSRGRMLLSRGRSAGPVMDRAHVAPASKPIDPFTRTASLWTSPDAASPTGSPARTTLQSFFKPPRISSDGETTPRISFQRSRPFIHRARTIDVVHTVTDAIEDTTQQDRATPLPRLELNLPSSEMERYSVMFETVLDSKPSLLERRKSRLRMLEMSREERIDSLPDLSRLTPLHMNKPNHMTNRPLTRSATSPSLSPSYRPKINETQAPTFHKPLALRRANTTPIPRISPLRASFVEAPSQQLPESPSSAGDTASFPNTPLHSGSAETEVQVIIDSSHLDAAAYHEHVTNVWQSVLPAPPGSSTSSRFSVDVHKALESPRLVTRSRSFNGRDSGNGPVVRQVQVATARRVSISRALHNARHGDPSRALRPKMIQVGSHLPLSQETSMLDIERGVSGLY